MERNYTNLGLIAGLLLLFAQPIKAANPSFSSFDTDYFLVVGTTIEFAVAPIISSFANATHTHQNAAGGGTLDTAAIASGTLAAARMPALTGDVTTSAGTVATTIANDAVTFAKFQNVSANSFIARADSSLGDISAVALAASQLAGRGASGNVAAITLGTGLSMSGATLNATGVQSVWTQNQDGGGFSLTNVSSLGAADSSVAILYVNEINGAGVPTIMSGTFTFQNSVDFQSGISSITNTAQYALATNFPGLDIWVTNLTHRLYVQSGFTLDSTITDAAQVTLLIEHNSNNHTNRCTTKQPVGLTEPGVSSVHGFIQPGGRFIFTNQSSGAATAVFLPESYQYVPQ